MKIDPNYQPTPCGAPLFDSHSHINSREFDEDRSEVIARMRQAGMTGAMVVACDWQEDLQLMEILKLAPGFLIGAWALHPEYEDRREPTVEEIVGINARPGMYAVGETGLDYYWCKGDLGWQRARFEKHIQAAQQLNKPLIIHAREAERDALEILQKTDAARTGFVMHCFGGDTETALDVVKAGGLVSVTGVVTFKNADALRETVRAVPLESLMLETDCPYMAPVPYRGKRAEPAHVKEIAQIIADIKHVTIQEVARVTTETAHRFFNFHP